ncbi:MAG: class I SAM-dependent methyltransferase [Silvibacterium sp.]|nr:class I SAM-dependent methyltransferase [Silvibacterium sp.]
MRFPDATSRFSGRVESYRLHRPGYPPAIVDLLVRECGLSEESLIADIAAGTGLLAEIFLECGYPVIAVEPNRQMREACASLTSQYRQLKCIEGTAEATELADHSVDLITVGQAMHWLDLRRTRSEFVRVLRPTGWCAVLYNNRRMSGDPFHEDYERILIEFGADYETVKHSHMTQDRIGSFFAPNEMRSASFENSQQLTLDGLVGRILSSSYMPQPGHPRYAEMFRATSIVGVEKVSVFSATSDRLCS